MHKCLQYLKTWIKGEKLKLKESMISDLRYLAYDYRITANQRVQYKDTYKVRCIIENTYQQINVCSIQIHTS